jgi:hypothetical protein
MAAAVQLREGRDYTTGYRYVSADIEVAARGVPGPMSVRARLEEWTTNGWGVSVCWGPWDERNARGSYYESWTLPTLTGTLSAARAHAKRLAKRAHRDGAPERS